MIVDDVILTCPEYSEGEAPLELHASLVGLGACLGQKQNVEFREIAYASTPLSKAEQRYSTIKRELVAGRWGSKRFQPVLYVRQFILVTDYQPYFFEQHEID